MRKSFNNVLLVMLVSIVPLSYWSAEAYSISSYDSTRLQKASGLINDKQYKQGFISFKSMAKQGCPYSQCILGIMRQKGTGIKKDAAQAKYWFQQSAQQGFADAQHRLGLMYLRGDGIKKNLVLAKQWLTKAANQGVIEARELLTQIPGEDKIASKVAQAPQRVTESATNIQKSWQGYSEVTKQLTQLSSASH